MGADPTGAGSYQYCWCRKYDSLVPCPRAARHGTVVQPRRSTGGARVPNQRGRPAAARLQDIRLVLVGQHALVRSVLRELIEAHPQIRVVAEAADVDEAIETIRDETPDVVLVDTEFPIYQIVPAVQRLKHECPGSPVVLLGHRGSDDEL